MKDKLKMNETKKKVVYEIYGIITHMERLMDFYESVNGNHENEIDMEEWFSNNYPFKMSLDETLFEINKFRETLESTINY